MTLPEEDHKSFYKIQKSGHCFLVRNKTEGDDGRTYLGWADIWIGLLSVHYELQEVGIVVFWDYRVFQLNGKKESLVLSPTVFTVLEP